MNQPLLQHAIRTMAVGSKSFASASRLFDPATRRSALMLYAWCRHCDDVIDGQHLGFTATPATNSPEQRLDQLQLLTHQAFNGQPMAEPAFAAFQEVALVSAIPRQLAFDHLAGYAMDVRGERYHTIDDTLRYCYHVAGVVGLMMAHVMGVRDDAVLDRACDLGLAFQLTNIARDLVEDAATGRCYLPLHWLADEGMTLDNYAHPSQRPALTRVAERLVAHAEPYYHSALDGLASLPWRSAWAIATARGVYRRIGSKVCREKEQAWNRRQGTTKAEKLALLCAGGGRAVISRFSTGVPRPEGLWRRPA